MDRTLAPQSSLARDFFDTYPEQEAMPLDLLGDEERRAYKMHVKPLAEAVARCQQPQARDANATTTAANDPRLAELTRLAVRVAQEATPEELGAARRAADYAQLTAVLALLSAAHHFAIDEHGRTVAAALRGRPGALERWQQEHVRRRLVAAGCARLTAPLAAPLERWIEQVQKEQREEPEDGDESAPPSSPPPRLFRPFAKQCREAREARSGVPLGQVVLPVPALRRRLHTFGRGCLDGLLSPLPGGWGGGGGGDAAAAADKAGSGGGGGGDAAATAVVKAQCGGGKAGGGKASGSGDGAVVLVGNAVARLATGGKGSANAPHDDDLDSHGMFPECFLQLALVGFASPADAARCAGDFLVAAVSGWRARHGGGVDEDERRQQLRRQPSLEPHAALDPKDGALLLLLPERWAGAERPYNVAMSLLPVCCGGGGGGEEPEGDRKEKDAPLLALERLLLRGGPLLPADGCHPTPALAFDGERLLGLPRAADALLGGEVVLEARAGGGGEDDEGEEEEEGAGGKDEDDNDGDDDTPFVPFDPPLNLDEESRVPDWADTRAGRLLREADDGFVAAIPVPRPSQAGGGGGGGHRRAARREARLLEERCADRSILLSHFGENQAEMHAMMRLRPELSAAGASWRYRGGFLPADEGASVDAPTALPEGLADAVRARWEELARVPAPRGPYELVAFGGAERG